MGSLERVREAEAIALLPIEHAIRRPPGKKSPLTKRTQSMIWGLPVGWAVLTRRKPPSQHVIRFPEIVFVGWAPPTIKNLVGGADPTQIKTGKRVTLPKKDEAKTKTLQV